MILERRTEQRQRRRQSLPSRQLTIPYRTHPHPHHTAIKHYTDIRSGPANRRDTVTLPNADGQDEYEEHDDSGRYAKAEDAEEGADELCAAGELWGGLGEDRGVLGWGGLGEFEEEGVGGGLRAYWEQLDGCEYGQALWLG